MHDLHRGQSQAVAQPETDPSHVVGGLHSGVEKRGQVGGADRAVRDVEPRRLADLMGCDPWRAQLGQDQPAMRHDSGEARHTDAEGELSRAERAFPGRAPHVDALRVEHQDPQVAPAQLAPQVVEAHLVVRGDEDRGLRRGLPDGVETGFHAIVHPPDRATPRRSCPAGRGPSTLSARAARRRRASEPLRRSRARRSGRASSALSGMASGAPHVAARGCRGPLGIARRSSSLLPSLGVWRRGAAFFVRPGPPHPSKNANNPATASSLTQQLMRCPSRWTCISPAWRSSFRWCETVEGARASSLPSSPTQQKLVDRCGVPFAPHDGARRRNMRRRWGFESALNIAATASILLSLFDMCRTIGSSRSGVKGRTPISGAVSRSVHARRPAFLWEPSWSAGLRDRRL